MATSFLDVSSALAYLSFPGSAFLVNAISWISLVLGLFFSLPFVVFVAYDILLWIWRTWSLSAQARDAQIPAAPGAIATKITAATTAITAISPEHHDQRARRR